VTSSDDDHDGPGSSANSEPRRDYADYHDPLAGIGGAPPAYSALTLRLVLACFGVLVCTAGAVIFIIADVPIAFTVILAVLAAVAVVDIGVIIRRKRRGEPG
jgi:Family of unknown function (DUF6343)